MKKPIKLCTNFEFADGTTIDAPHPAIIHKQVNDVVVCNMITHSGGDNKIPLKQEDTDMVVHSNSKILVEKATPETVKLKNGSEVVYGDFWGTISKNK
jgi:hypothetical protein